jgi:hypothetical protein
MAITDIQISEELETNAPSIKYRGNEGPKSPQEMQQKAEYDMQEYIIEFENVFPEMKKLRGTEEYMDMLEDYFRGLAKGPVLPSDEDPINPFQPKPQGPVLPDRQMAAYGGIMGMDGRKQYGIGSFFQEKIMDPIKNNPLVAAAAAAAGVDYFGIPDYDILGPIGGMGGNKILTGGNTIGELLAKKPGGDDADKDDKSYGEMITSAIGKNIIPIVGGLTAGLFTDSQGGGQDASTYGAPSDNTALQLDNLKKSANILDQKQGMAAGLNFLPAVAARKYTPAEMIETYAQAAANGGRIGMAEGGLMNLGGMEKDYRAEGGFVPIGKEEKADDVPARLSVNEFVFTADAVRNAGGGDIDQGAQVMENMMKHLEAGGQVSEESQGMAGARDMFATSQRLGDVV